MKRAEWVAILGFEPDPFQLSAMDALDEGRSVLVAAPTGAGKTLVAEYAIARALAEGGKAFYTSPLKALSNQKYGDLLRVYGRDRVGLLTGDNSINPDAAVVVMTTEVLRNMIYARSGALEGLRYVVLDEVHYLQNPYRGAVWEEVIIHLADDVKLVCLSATVSNAEEFAAWIETVRGATTAVIEEKRPVELRNLYMVGDRRSEQLHLLPTFVDGRPNAEAATLDANHAGPGWTRRRSGLHTPRRTEVVEALADSGILPAIYFIFSRAACDDAVRNCLNEGLRLTSAEERPVIRAIAEAHTAALSDEDLRVLGYDQWITALEAGMAAHHAGMVPPFKEAVEIAFAAGLVKVVFATETLALGVNMPARTVVIEKLSKFTGEHHEFLTPGEYTQLTGRAGRRGIDELGHAVVLWSPFVAFEQVAALASRRANALTSSFRPTYNMAANLVRRYRPDHARHLLNLSFAQYRTDAEVVRLETHLERAQSALAEARSAAHCGLGSVEEYRSRLRRIRQGAKGGEDKGRSREEIRLALERLRPGDVLIVPGVSGGGRVAVVATSRRKGGEMKVSGVTPDGRPITITAKELMAPLRPVARLPLPTPYEPSSNRFLRETAADLRRLELPGVEPPAPRQRRKAQAETVPDHPVAACPDRAAHVRALDRSERLANDAERLERRIRGRSESLARQFDRVLSILERWGYVGDWTLTTRGEQLCRIYHESDLLIAECLGEGMFEDLDAPSLVALASGFTFESRGPSGSDGLPPPRHLRDRIAGVESLAGELNREEELAGLPPTRTPEFGFASVAYAWAAGRQLGEVVSEETLSGGDFVRNVKSLIDLVRQLGQVAVHPATAAAARAGADALFRGVVAASSAVAAEAEEDDPRSLFRAEAGA